MNSTLTKSQLAAINLAACRAAHQAALDDLNLMISRGMKITDFGVAATVKQTAAELFKAANIYFLERDLANDERIKAEKLARAKSPFARFLVWLW